MMTKVRNMGFSMIEVSVAVVIIAVVAVVVVPRLIGTTEKTYVSDAVSALKTLHGAQQMRILQKGAGMGATDCSLLDVTLPSSSNFYPASCNADGSVQLIRKGLSTASSYTLTINSAGVFTCTGSCSSVSKVITLGTSVGQGG